MARIPLNYWEKRNTELMKQMEKGTEKTINSLVQAYEQATKDINKEIERIFYNYGEDTGLKKETLLKLLNSKETEIHYNNLLKTINKISDKDIRKKMLAKYNAPAYQYRISRYEALQQNIDVELKKLAGIEKNVTEIRYTDTLKEGYNKNIYNVQKKLGIGFNFSQIDTKAINLLLNEKWTNNANFSQRIWKNSEKLGNYLKVKLTADTMSGKSIQKISKELSEYMNIGLYNSTRLVRTEVTYFSNQSEIMSLKELGFKKYRFVATLDNRTSEMCQESDNRVFLIKDAKPGINVPPLHPFCRSTIVAEFDDDIIEDLSRRAIDNEGQPILIPQDMDYKEWKAKHINMTSDEKGAISEYSSSKAYSLNEKLRNNQKLEQYEQELISNIDKGLWKIPNYNNITYRQIGFDFQGKEEYNKFINQHKNNDYINYQQYISTSKHYGDYEVDDEVKVEIIIDGKTGKDIRGLAGIKEENEVVFGRNVLFKIIKVEGNKIWLKEV